MPSKNAAKITVRIRTSLIARVQINLAKMCAFLRLKSWASQLYWAGASRVRIKIGDRPWGKPKFSEYNTDRDYIRD